MNEHPPIHKLGDRVISLNVKIFIYYRIIMHHLDHMEQL